MRFEFATAQRIVFGAGSLKEIGSLARELGTHACVVTGSNPARAARLMELLAGAQIRAALLSVRGEPTLATITTNVRTARESGCDFVIGLGGGSVLDAAKAVAAMLTNGGELLDYLEVVGRGLPLPNPAAPCIAIPTTAGAGSEATRNAVLTSPAHGLKVSLRSPHMLPRVALVDPEQTYDLPPALTASTGLDALTQLIEPYVCLRANAMTDGLCVDGIGRIARSLRRAVDDGRDAAAREGMALASLFGGIALANAGLGAVHGFASPIGGKFPAPHGAVCAALLPSVTAANIAALRTRAPQHPSLRRYDEVARLLTGKAHASADEGVTWLQELVTQLSIPRLGTYGIKPADIPALVVSAGNASSMKANPIALTGAELSEALAAAL